MKLPDLYKKNFLEIEGIIALAVVIVLYIILLIFLTPDQFNTLVTNTQSKVYPVISIGAITLLGFIITGISILITFTEIPALKPLKTSPQYTNLFKIYFSAIKHLGVLTLVSIVGMLISYSLVSQIIFYLVILFIITSILRIWRCLWVLERFIRIIQVASSHPN